MNKRAHEPMSPDPYGEFFSPYLAMGNNPVSTVDPDGGKVMRSGTGAAFDVDYQGRERKVEPFDMIGNGGTREEKYGWSNGKLISLEDDPYSPYTLDEQISGRISSFSNRTGSSNSNQGVSPNTTNSNDNLIALNSNDFIWNPDSKNWSAEFSFKRVGFVPLDEDVGFQMATYEMILTVWLSDELVLSNSFGIIDENKLINISAISTNSFVEGDVEVNGNVSLIQNGILLKSKSFVNRGNNIVKEGYNFVGTATFRYPSDGKVQLRVNTGWSVKDISGGRSVPIYHPITYPKSININTLIDIPRL